MPLLSLFGIFHFARFAFPLQTCASQVVVLAEGYSEMERGREDVAGGYVLGTKGGFGLMSTSSGGSSSAGSSICVGGPL